MYKRVKKGVLYFVLGFVVLFVLRVIYDYLAYPNGQTQIAHMVSNHWLRSEDFSKVKNNYASQSMQRSSSIKASTLQVNQKYEKVATVAANTSVFKQDEAQVRKLIESYNALIQFEQNAGLQGNRSIHLAIGVDPDKFDVFTQKISEIGSLSFFQINKTDKTNEYKDLQAKQMSLQKARKSLIGLKSKGGKVEELIGLENRILDIENQIQGLGVKLGDFDTENEFCTVKYTLQEQQSLLKNTPLTGRLKAAFEWTVLYYFALLTLLLFASLSSLFLLLTIDKLSPLIKKLNE